MNSDSRGVVIATPTDLEITLTRAFDAPRELVFDAWTKPEHLRRWLGRQGDEMIVCDVDLRVGGGWRFVWRLREGPEMGLHGVYREIERPSRLVSTEAFEGMELEQMGGETLSTLTFEEQDGKTTVVNTILYASREARDSALASGMEDGTNEGFGRLDELLAAIAATR